MFGSWTRAISRIISFWNKSKIKSYSRAFIDSEFILLFLVSNLWRVNRISANHRPHGWTTYTARSLSIWNAREISNGWSIRRRQNEYHLLRCAPPFQFLWTQMTPQTHPCGHTRAPAHESMVVVVCTRDCALPWCVLPMVDWSVASCQRWIMVSNASGIIS